MKTLERLGQRIQNALRPQLAPAIAAPQPAPPDNGALRQRRMLLGLLAALRPTLGGQPHLLKLIDDAALLLQGGAKHPHAEFTLAALTDAALASARALHPPRKPLHISVAVAPDLPPDWHGDAERLESLCRHLLLIGLQRCRSGLVRLQLEPVWQDQALSRLRLRLEDSGPPLQRGQMQQWLDGDGAAPPPARHDTSWLLAGQLFHALGGSAAADCDEHGLHLAGSIPLGEALTPARKPASLSPADPLHYFQPPLVLALADAAGGDAHDTIAAAMAAAGYAVFAVGSYPQLLDWAPVLPVSAIVIDARMAESGPALLRELQRLADHGALQPVPVWAVTHDLDIAHMQEWRDAGAAEVMALPLPQGKLRRWRKAMPSVADWFYCRADDHLRGNLPDEIVQQLPAMDRELFARLADIRTSLGQLAHGEKADSDACAGFHAVRSIGLSLGYHRLAALMAAMEATAASEAFAATPGNWLVVRDYLCPGDCFFSLSAAPASLTDAGMSALPGFKL